LLIAMFGSFLLCLTQKKADFQAATFRVFFGRFSPEIWKEKMGAIPFSFPGFPWSPSESFTLRSQGVVGQAALRA
jgi:hypothetical protein